MSTWALGDTNFIFLCSFDISPQGLKPKNGSISIEHSKVKFYLRSPISSSTRFTFYTFDFPNMSSRKKPRQRICLGCHTQHENHQFGKMHKAFQGPSKDGEDSDHEVDIASTSKTDGELLQAIRILSQQVGTLQIDQKDLREQLQQRQDGLCNTRKSVVLCHHKGVP
ncbi:hypothetical protein AC249_AIPGENE11073 [Exaiptasia diaphana]|nr:hypothetical protein AC249_AIPGENE11073 [Exaiptasia diaphana]